MKWYLIEDYMTSRSAVFETALKAETQAEAVAEALDIYTRQHPHDKRDCAECYICRVGLDDYGAIDYETMADYVDIKAAAEEDNN